MGTFRDLRAALNQWARNRDWNYLTLLAAGMAVLTVFTSYYAYRVTSATRHYRDNVERFAERISVLRSRTNNSSESRDQGTFQTIENPLSYLEETVDQDDLAGLGPDGERDGVPVYQMSLEGLPLSEIVSLLRTFSRHPDIVVVDFSVERIGMGANSFDGTFRLKIS
jgi:hypothetical protein